MTQLILVDLPQGCNAELLRAELRAAVGEWVAGVSRTPAGWWVVVEDGAPADIEQQFQAVLAAHNPDALTPEQQAAADAEGAARTIREIAAARIAWHEANPITASTTMAEALQVLGRIQAEWVYFLKWAGHRLA